MPLIIILRSNTTTTTTNGTTTTTTNDDDDDNDNPEYPYFIIGRTFFPHPPQDEFSFLVARAESLYSL